MKRRKALQTIAYTGAYGFLFTQIFSCKSQGSKKPTLVTIPKSENDPFEMKYLKGNVGIFKERGGTVAWMVDGDNIVVVDTQFPEQAQNLANQLAKMSDNKVDVLINTHHHGDHTAGNIVFKDLTDRIVAHENSKTNQMRAAKQYKREEGQLYPNEVFSESWSESIGGEKISMAYLGAAHTNGDSIVHFENANVVHMGDLVFNRRFPYIDKSAGADIGNWINVLDKVDKLYPGDATFIYGHCGEGYDVTGGKEEIKAFKNYLERLLEFGEASIAAGKTLEEVKAEAKLIPGAEEWKGDGISRSLDAVYQELTTK